jgi:predicted acetylornithine/succinylornithine family transaminase
MASTTTPTMRPNASSSRPAKDEHVLHTYLRADEVFVEGRGCELVDENGKVYLDFLSGIAVSALGHNHPELVAALRDQLGRVTHTSNLYRHPYTEEVATRIARLSRLDSVFFTNSGAEAVEAALKIARKHQRSRGNTSRTGFVALEGSFHGRTMGALSITHTEKYRTPFEPLIPGVTFVAPDDRARLAEVLRTKQYAALIAEPIQGESGVREVPVEFLRLARELCTETGTVLIHDEVQCGSGRTGTFLFGEQLGLAPDIATLAKPIGAGLPMGACVVSRDFADVLVPGDHGSTFAGGPLVLRGALVFLTLLEEGGLQQRVRERGAELRSGLADMQGDLDVITELRGRGLIQGVRLARGAEDVQKRLYARGLIVNRTGGDVLRLLPAYVITSDEIQRGLALLRDELAKL